MHTDKPVGCVIAVPTGAACDYEQAHSRALHCTDVDTILEIHDVRTRGVSQESRSRSKSFNERPGRNETLAPEYDVLI